MTAVVIHYWVCLQAGCDAHGFYPDLDTKTDTSPAAKHGHSTMTTTRAEFAARCQASHE
jgi:hypothetical protein